MFIQTHKAWQTINMSGQWSQHKTAMFTLSLLFKSNKILQRLYRQNMPHVVLRNHPSLSTGTERFACLNNLCGMQLGTLGWYAVGPGLELWPLPVCCACLFFSTLPPFLPLWGVCFFFSCTFPTTLWTG